MNTESVESKMAVFKVIAGLIAARMPRRRKTLGRPAEPLVRLTLADQWQRLTETLTQSIDRAEQAQQLQAAATRQLDLAQYAMTTLVDELAAVMAVPGRRASAIVHRFEVPARQPAGQALAA
jgi:hypothetical protein